MKDEERKEIYSVARFPPSDLSDMMAGVAPDKDFSNAKPTNQVSANTFATYIEPYVRPLTEEDIAFLKEKVCPGSAMLRIRIANPCSGRSYNSFRDAAAWKEALC
jgi:hypothetical protein